MAVNIPYPSIPFTPEEINREKQLKRLGRAFQTEIGRIRTDMQGGFAAVRTDVGTVSADVRTILERLPEPGGTADGVPAETEPASAGTAPVPARLLAASAAPPRDRQP